MTGIRQVRTPLFLISNLGAEVSRIFSAKKRGDYTEVGESLTRAENIIIQLKKHEDMRRRVAEMELLDQAIRDVAKETSTLSIKQKNLQAYFIPFVTRLMAKD